MGVHWDLTAPSPNEHAIATRGVSIVEGGALRGNRSSYRILTEGQGISSWKVLKTELFEITIVNDPLAGHERNCQQRRRPFESLPGYADNERIFLQHGVPDSQKICSSTIGPDAPCEKTCCHR